MGFAQRLFDAVRARDSVVVVGLDPHLDKLPGDPPATLDEAADRAADYLTGVLEAAAPYAVAVKPQVAFFETLGAPGWAAWQRLIAAARALDLLVVGDIKRGDIGSTSRAYATAHLARELLPGVPNPQRCDCVTVNPYLGGDALGPFVDAAAAADGGLFVLLKTSNPGSADVQDLPLDDGRPLHERLARWLVEVGAPHVDDSGYSAVGAVVGATHPELATVLRPALPGVPLLLPGFGAQGARADDLGRWFDADGLGAVVPASRSLAFAWRPEHGGDGDPARYREATAAAARTMRDQLNRVRGAVQSA